MKFEARRPDPLAISILLIALGLASAAFLTSPFNFSYPAVLILTTFTVIGALTVLLLIQAGLEEMFGERFGNYLVVLVFITGVSTLVGTVMYGIPVQVSLTDGLVGGLGGAIIFEVWYRSKHELEKDV